MMNLHSMGDRCKKRQSTKRVGRGIGSGKGKTCGRGTKGAKARSGYKKRWGNEGGQLPLYRKIPIRGFSGGRRVIERIALNVGLLNYFYADGDIVDLSTLSNKGVLASKKKVFLKILGNGSLEKKLLVHAHAFSLEAKEKIKKVKGEACIIV